MRDLNTQLRLKALVTEAVQALGKLDANRLEELAISCRVLNSDPAAAMRAIPESDLRSAGTEMAALARVLEATRANLDVMNRLREFHARRMEYKSAQSAADGGAEVIHGIG